MSLNSFRDEARRFMQLAGSSGDNTDKLLGWLDEEFELLKQSKENPKAFQHQVYDMLFLLFSIAAKDDMDLDMEWAEGREKKKKYLPDSASSIIEYDKN